MSEQLDSIDEAVEQTLAWVSYGEPNSADLIDVAGSNYPVAGRYGGFRGNDERIVSHTEFVHGLDESTCVIQIVSPDGVVELDVDGEMASYDSHEAGIRAFYEWADRS